MSKAMKVLILVPAAYPALSGNAVTVERWRRSLSAMGVDVEVVATRDLSTHAFDEKIARNTPDIIHVHHAFKAGGLLLDPFVSGKCGRVPIVASPGGTDINVDLEIPERREVVIQVLRTASSIVSQSTETAQYLRRRFPDLRDRIVYVPKASCWLGDEPYDLRKAAGIGSDHFLFFLPAGVRPVKGNLECLLALEKVHVLRPEIRFVAAGPGMDREYADRFRREVARLSSFASWVEGIPPSCMPSAYNASQVVLNFSFSEGLSNALLEAIASGRPVLATNIAGNRYPVLGTDGDQPAGILFDPKDPNDFTRSAVRLVDDVDFRRSFEQAIRTRNLSRPTPETEAAGLMAVYESAILYRQR